MLKLLIKIFLISNVICLTVFLYVQTGGLGGNLVNESITDEVQSGHDVDDDEGVNVFIVNGFKAFKLDEEVVLASGLAFEKPQSISFVVETLAYAEIINVAPLVLLKTEYQNVLADRKVFQNELHNQNKVLKRAEALHKVKSLSTRDLEKNRADRDLKASQLNAMNTRVSSFEYKIKSLWGNTLSNLILGQGEETLFSELASHETSLITVSLPKNKTLMHQQQRVFVSHVNQRDTAFLATYLQQAQQVSNPLYGESYIYFLKSQKIRAGMRLFAWIEENGENIEGYFIPENAIVWYANEPWIYIKQGEELFLRKPLGGAKKIDKGWLLKDKSLVGEDVIVTVGGQILLSEEFKWAIPDEDDD